MERHDFYDFSVSQYSIKKVDFGFGCAWFGRAWCLFKKNYFGFGCAWCIDWELARSTRFVRSVDG